MLTIYKDCQRRNEFMETQVSSQTGNCFEWTVMIAIIDEMGFCCKSFTFHRLALSYIRKCKSKWYLCPSFHFLSFLFYWEGLLIDQSYFPLHPMFVDDFLLQKILLIIMKLGMLGASVLFLQMDNWIEIIHHCKLVDDTGICILCLFDVKLS